MFTLKFLTKSRVITFIVVFLLLVINIAPAGKSAASLFTTVISVFIVSVVIALVVDVIVRYIKRRTK